MSVDTSARPWDSTPVLPRGWDAAFYTLTALSAASMLVAEHTTLRWLIVSEIAVLALLVAYPLLGRRGLLAGDHRMIRWYLVLLIVVVATASSASSLGTMLLFVGYSQIWLLSGPLRAGITWSAALTVAVALSMLIGHPWAWHDVPVLLGQLGIGLLFSLVMGWWLTQIGRSREQREELLHRLRTAEAELSAGHHAAGVLAERGRVAQEIHDTLAQGFTSVVMLAQTAQAQVEHDRLDDAAGRLAQIEAVARDNLAEARSLVAAFGPSGLLEDDLPSALHRVAERLEQESGLMVTVRVDGALPLGREHQVVLLRTAQEALNNVRRHAQASRVMVRLDRDGDGVLLEVTDDGRGLAADTSDGVGLRGMRHRITTAGGTLRVENSGPGVRVLARIPVPEDEGTPS